LLSDQESSIRREDSKETHPFWRSAACTYPSPLL